MTDGLKSFLCKGEGWRMGGQAQWSREYAASQFFGPTARRNESDTDLHQSHVRLGGSHHAVGVQGKLGSASQRLPVGRCHYRLGTETQAHHQVLEGYHRLMQLLELSLPGCHANHKEVGSHTEVAGLVADHQATPALGPQFTDR